MNLKDIIAMLDDYFDKTSSRENRTQDTLLTIINKLEQKQDELKAEMIKQSETDETSEAFHDMQKQLKVISKLLKKAGKKQAKIKAELLKKSKKIIE